METLADRISRDGPLNELDAVGWAIRLAKRIEALHALGVAHGSISPACVVTTAVDRSSKGVLVDVRRIPSRLAYQSPERAAGGDLSPTDDVWAIAATLYEMLTATSAFGGVNDVETRQRLSAASPAPLAVFDVGDDDLQHIIDSAFQREPAARIRNAAALRKALEEWHPDMGVRGLRALEDEDSTSDDDDDDVRTVMRAGDLTPEPPRAGPAVQRPAAGFPAQRPAAGAPAVGFGPPPGARPMAAAPKPLERVPQALHDDEDDDSAATVMREYPVPRGPDSAGRRGAGGPVPKAAPPSAPRGPRLPPPASASAHLGSTVALDTSASPGVPDAPWASRGGGLAPAQGLPASYDDDDDDDVRTVMREGPEASLAAGLQRGPGPAASQVAGSHGAFAATAAFSPQAGAPGGFPGEARPSPYGGVPGGGHGGGHGGAMSGGAPLFGGPGGAGGAGGPAAAYPGGGGYGGPDAAPHAGGYGGPAGAQPPGGYGGPGAGGLSPGGYGAPPGAQQPGGYGGPGPGQMPGGYGGSGPAQTPGGYGGPAGMAQPGGFPGAGQQPGGLLGPSMIGSFGANQRPGETGMAPFAGAPSGPAGMSPFAAPGGLLPAPEPPSKSPWRSVLILMLVAIVVGAAVAVLAMNSGAV